jgi:hypothetical protein
MALLQRDGSIDFRSSPESKRQIHIKLRSSPSNAQAGRLSDPCCEEKKTDDGEHVEDGFADQVDPWPVTTA